MADAIVSVVVKQLASFVQQEVKLLVSVRKDVNALTSTLQMLQAVLRDAEIRQIKEEAVKLWLKKLKDIVYDAEDVLDEWNTRHHNSFIQGVDEDGVRLHKKVLSYLLSPCFSVGSVVVRYGIGSRIKDIRERLDDVANEKEKFKLKQTQFHEEPRERLTCSVIDVSNTYGRDYDKSVIVGWILGESSGQKMNTDVISIVGTGGFGKTTLAKLVLKEAEVEKAFEKRMWVCVSDPFKLIEVAKAIIHEAEENIPSANEWEALHKCLCDTLKRKRFLLVLDDVWTEDPNHWDPLKLAFDGGAQGSRVIVTTRSENVAKTMGSKHTHNLAKLSDDDSWSLFEHIAFAGRHEERSKFEDIGKKIATKCKGVPLVVKTVGSLMRYKKSKNEWNNVLASEILELQSTETEILSSLFMSYNPLPSYLKQCFMYCAIFPKDTQIDKDDMVKLWMAQGFLGSGGNRDLEKVGHDSYDDLAMRSFFQDFEKSPEGNITSSKMHDLVHDFALFLTKGEYSYLEVGGELNVNDVRHLVTKDIENSSIYLAKNLRTLAINKSINPDQLIRIFNQLKCIRMLDLSYSRIEELPSEVKKLIHLRYLNLSLTSLVELPETICHLYNLQTLKLNRCRALIKLPDGIGNLFNLRHLELEETKKLRCLPQGVGSLRFLRSLSKFIVGNASNGCNISQLKNLSFLQGSLNIHGLVRVTDASEAAQAELKSKAIVVLSLGFESLEEEEEENSENTEQGKSENMTGVLENLQPHENVEELNIDSFRGSRFPSWMSNSSMLANLLRLTLISCHYTTKLPALGNLASLEELVITKMKSVKHIGSEFYGHGIAFPKLKKLDINDMEELVKLEVLVPTDGTILSCLQVLVLSECPKLGALPGLGRLESLERLEIYKLCKVKHIGHEFCGFDDGDKSNSGVMVVAFPQLKILTITEMSELVEWELPIAKDNKTIMPCLSELEMSDCPMLRALPSLGTLESLESLSFKKLPSIKQVGLEFSGISADEFGDCSIQERVINGGGEREGEEPIIPNLRTTLRNLCNSSFSKIKHLGFKFLGAAERKVSEEQGAGATSSSSSFCKPVMLIFPKLTKLKFDEGGEWEDWIIPPFEEGREIIIMPLLCDLEVSWCLKLRVLPDLARFKSLEFLHLKGLKKSEWEEREDDISLPRLKSLTLSYCSNLHVIPRYLLPHTLRHLKIDKCKELRGVQPCLPPLLESLVLSDDVGVFSETIPISEEEEEEENNNNNNNNNKYPNLVSLEIDFSKHPSLPKGFNHLTAIRDLQFFMCESLDFDLNELKHLIMLQDLTIAGCPILSKRFQSPGGEDWMSILSHVSKIYVDGEYINQGSW